VAHAQFEAVDADDGIPTVVVHSDAERDADGVAGTDASAFPHAARVVDADGALPPSPVLAPSPALQEALVKLRDVFKLRGLRPGQAEIIESILAGRDTLAIMPTGSGKSLTYQLPALVLPGPTIVVSPLLALIEDQVGKLQAAGVRVARIDSTRTAKERAADLEAVREGAIKLVIITPESIGSPTVQAALEGVKFSLFAVDEAHCVSQWGHDFRPAYLGLRRAANVLGRPPILALTATATPTIADDVLVQLGMRDSNVCRVSFHRPNLAFDVRKVAGEADKLRQLGKLIQRLRRPGIVYCATVRAVDELYVALRHGKIPVERYNGKMTQDEREKAQASFMQGGRKVVMLATNAFGLGVDKPDIRYIIHYQMPGSPEAYVQEAGRAGRDGKPARCVLLFQPEDIEIQEHFLREAHPTKSQARMVAEGLYAWSDEGKEVSVRDLALSMALPERRVRVILSVLEAMGVAEEVKAARWKGVEPKPTRERIDKAASVFEARRISDRRRLASLLAYMNTQRCRVQMMRAYFGEPEGAKCGLCDSCAGLDSEVFDPGEDARHGLHAATDFHARPRRRRRRGGEPIPQQPQHQQVGRGPAPQARPPQPQLPAVITFATAIPTDLLPPLPAVVVGPSDESQRDFDPGIWNEVDERAGTPMAGDAVIDLAELTGQWPVSDEVVAPVVIAATQAPGESESETTPAAVLDPDRASWDGVRDANIRAYIDWRVVDPVSLPVMARAPVVVSHGGGGAGRPPQGFSSGGNGGGGQENRNDRNNDRNDRNGHGQGGPRAGKRRRRGGGGGQFRDGNGGGGGGSHGHDRGRSRDRDRGPRLPGFYNPGGD
jgi:ATP-dependent DNA helicase RecQ